MSINEIHDRLQEEVELTQDEKDTIEALLDPVIWSENTLKNPDDPTKPLRLRKYQRVTLRFQPKEVINEKGELILEDRIKVYRMGRRLGKTVSLAIEALHKACTNHNFRILYIAPFESQCSLFFGMIEKLLNNSPIEATRFVRKPYMCQFKNGSTITAHTANVRSTRKGSTIRGAEGDLIIIDEMDHGIDEVINEVVMPILMGNNKATMICSSTPTGRRGLFYTWCTEGYKMGMKTFHYTSQESPKWTSESEKLAQKTMTRDQYIHEILADFGEALEGVFKHKDLDLIMKKYDCKKLKYNKKDNYYIMGIDWNERHGTCIVIVEKNKRSGHYRIFKNITVPRQEFTQLEGIAKILELHDKYHCDFIYADHGFGSTQIELLKKHGLENPMTKLHNIVKDIDYGGNIEIRDPISGALSKKPAKAFLVDNSVLAIEAKNISIPEDEDTEFGLIGQMRNFRVTKFSKSGHPVYEGKLNGVDNDHTLNAFMLALTGYTLEYGDINKYEVNTDIAYVKNIYQGMGYRRSNVQEENISKFVNLLKRVTPNFKQYENESNKKTSFISSHDIVRKNNVFEHIRRKKYGIKRDNI